MWVSALKHCEKEHSAPLFSILLDNIEEGILQQRKVQTCNTLTCYLRLLESSIAFKHGFFILDQNAILQVCSGVLQFALSTSS